MEEGATKCIEYFTKRCATNDVTHEFYTVLYRERDEDKTATERRLSLQISDITLTDEGREAFVKHLETHKGILLLCEPIRVEFDEDWIRVWVRKSKHRSFRERMYDLRYVANEFLGFTYVSKTALDSVYKVRPGSLESVAYIALYNTEYDLRTAHVAHRFWDSKVLFVVKRDNPESYHWISEFAHKVKNEHNPEIVEYRKDLGLMMETTLVATIPDPNSEASKQILYFDPIVTGGILCDQIEMKTRSE